MTFLQLLTFNLALLAAIASPGPSMLYLIHTALTRGRKQACAAALGLGLVASGYTFLALLGLGAVLRAMPLAFGVLKALGALYLIWLAIRMWRAAPLPLATTGPSSRTAFWGGICINLANPKALLFAGAVLVLIFPQRLDFWDQSLIVMNHLFVEVLCHSLLGLALGGGALRRGYHRAKPVLERGAALVLGALGIRLLTSET